MKRIFLLVIIFSCGKIFAQAAGGSFPALINDTTAFHDSTIYTEAEVMPGFPGGESELMKFPQSHIRYPEDARDNGTQGKVISSFTVCTDGTCCDFKILKGVSPSINREVIRMLQSMPKWKPGMINGVPVRVQFNLPVNFKLAK